MSLIKSAAGQRSLTTIVLLDRGSGNKLLLETPVAVNCHTVHSFATLLCIKGAKHFQYDQERRVVTITFDKFHDFDELEREVPALLEREHIYTTIKRSRSERIREYATLLWRATVLVAQFLWKISTWTVQRLAELTSRYIKR